MEGTMTAEESGPTPFERVGNTLRYLIHAWFVLAVAVIGYAIAEPWIAGADETRAITALWLTIALGALWLVSRQY